MGLLAGKNYDPATAVAGTTKSTAAALAMTAIDTTNLRNAFTVPASGKVFVYLAVSTAGATTFPQILLGVLQGSTVIHRQIPMTGSTPATVATTTPLKWEAGFTVDGLTPGANLTWDMAYGVETGVGSTGLRYGGPNNTTATDAWGAAVFQVWEA